MQTQSETQRIAGLGTALVTPFAADGAVDWRALERLVARQVAAGVDFLVPLGSTGEASTLSEDEQLSVLETTLRVADGRVPVLAGCTHNDTRALIERARRFAAAGARQVLAASPYYNKPTQEGIYRHYRALREATGLDVAAYTIPGRTAGNIEPGTVARLVADGIVFALKESSGNIQQIQMTCRLVGDRCAVLAGDDAMTLPTLAVGGAGVIAVASNAIPGVLRDWVALLRRGDFPQARTELGRLLPLFEACGVEPNPMPIKAGMHLLGLLQPHHRLPLVPAGEGTVAAMQRALAPFRE